MNNTLQKQPWFLLLLPFFFVLHGYAENFGFVSSSDVFILGLLYLAAAIILFALFSFFLKDRRSVALIASYILAVNFFFGAVQDFFKIHVNEFSRYFILLPLFIILFIALLFYVKRKKRSFFRLTLFLNLLFLIFIFVDIGSIIFENINPPPNKFSVYFPPGESDLTPCIDCDKPDIYFLLFDEYASSNSLKKDFNYDNSSFDSFLVDEGFHIQRESKSNYNFTPFSMASMLNMSYLSGIEPSKIGIEDYARCNELIKSNSVIKILSSLGYEIVNYSIFDLPGNPAMIRQDFLPLKTKLITDGTLLSRLRKDLMWRLLTGKFKIDWLADQYFYDNMHNNDEILKRLIASSTTFSKSPRFFYAHLFMPHPPFYFDEKGNLKPPAVIFTQSEEKNVEAYLSYVAYTNARIRELIQAIKNNTKTKPVIILMGDHGFRKELDRKELSHYFANQNAVFFPSKDYDLFYDSITAVNQFRLVLNTVFKQILPILKDSTVFLTDKK
ncbi:MAG: sulfatase-like hydrolase/transferase [Ginsengibacter sp.]